jgi:CubicO group peptidase (beta-lactamase class C family)
MHRALFLALFLAAGLAHAAEESKEPPTPKTLDELKLRIAEIVEKSKTPGAGVALVTREGVSFVGGFGLADVASTRAADADTMFRIGSTSKGFVALAALKLVEQGKLSLDAPLWTLAPEIAFQNPWENTDPVRIVHLLEHTTGWDDIHLRDYAHESTDPDGLKAALDYDPDSRVSRWRPGTRSAYCNVGPAVVAYVIEKITGEKFEAFVQREFFDPIGMPRSSYFLTDEVKTTQATLYKDDSVTPVQYWHFAMRPAGMINASPREMAEYVRFYLNRGSVNGVALVSPESIARMEKPLSNLSVADGLTTGYGLHNYASLDDDGFLWHGHNGGVLGGASDMSYLPEAGVGYSLLVNGIQAEGFPKLSKLLRAYLTQDLPKPKPGGPEVKLDAALAAKYEGFYLPASPRVELIAPLEKIAAVLVFDVKDDGSVQFGPLLGEKKRFVPVAEGARLLRREDAAVPTLALLSSEELGDSGIVAEWNTFVRSPEGIALAPLVLFTLMQLLTIALFVYLMVWGIRLMYRKVRRRDATDLKQHLGLRLWPLAASVALMGFLAWIGLVFVDEDLFNRYGAVTGYSLGIALMSLAAVVIPLYAAWKALQPEYRAAHGGLKWFAWITLGLQSACALYIAVVGMVPFVTWG